MCDFTIGHGYDVHRLVKGRKLILGGTEVPFIKGLLGHSDADVLTHALMDAVLGALALPDIGRQFPDNDPEYEGISSLVLASRVAKLMDDAGYMISNADITVIAEKPKLAPYTDSMRKNLAEVFSCEVSQINIKATTEEGLGFSGRIEGISAHAVCLLRKK